ncbi:Matrilin-4 [Mactra antiquata]
MKLIIRLAMRLLASFVVLSVVTLGTSQQCDDINASACQLLAQSQPDYCSDFTAKTTCPRFCKLCPVECYNCNATVLDYHECNTTILCGQGEICMKKELKSYIDGHHEYEMTCQTKQACDGGGLNIPFGKRDIETRDISITCCADDFCNYPELKPTVTAGCPKDIIFMVDESSGTIHKEYANIKAALQELASALKIGQGANLMSVYGFDTQIHSHFDLNDNLNQLSLLSAIQGIQFPRGSVLHRADTKEAVEFLINYATGTRAGDRPKVPDVIVMLSDSSTAQNFHLTSLERYQLQQISHDIITVTVGTNSLWSSPTDQIATDRNHVVHVASLSNSAAFVNTLLPLITKC